MIDEMADAGSSGELYSSEDEIAEEMNSALA